jgi:hypothetical protein
VDLATIRRTRGGKRLDVDDLSDPDVETSEVV